jgi:hypothetical protein
MTRGILYMVWPGERVEAALERSIASVKSVHPELPVTVIQADTEPGTRGLLAKSRMAEHSPYDATLFLDADTIVLGDLSFGFEQAERHSLACCICECPWARRYGGLRSRGDIIEYNTGVMFFTKSAAPLFDEWSRRGGMDSSIRFNTAEGEKVMPVNDQGSFAAAVDALGFNPCILPLNWNFRPMWHNSMFGPIKVWHDYSDVPPAILEWNAQQSEPSAVIGYARVA